MARLTSEAFLQAARQGDISSLVADRVESMNRQSEAFRLLDQSYKTMFTCLKALVVAQAAIPNISVPEIAEFETWIADYKAWLVKCLETETSSGSEKADV